MPPPDGAPSPETSTPTLLLAHGSGQPMDDPLLEALAVGVAATGPRVERFEFPFMARRRAGERCPIDADDVLARSFRDQLARLRDAPRTRGPVLIGGVSLGARIAAAIAADVAPAGLVCVSFPFHPAGDPADRSRVRRLQALTIPTLIVQGTRDKYGNRERVRGYHLTDPIEVVWLDDANHGLVPRVRSGLNFQAHLATTIAAIGRFCQGRAGRGAAGSRRTR